MIYSIILVLLVVLTVVFAMPNMTLYIGILTFGFGIVLAFLCVNLLILHLSFLPAKFLPSGYKLVGVGIGLVIYATYLFGPGYIAKQRANSLVAATTATDFTTSTKPENVRSFALNYPDAKNDAQCTDACKALLFSGDADWVRVAMGRNKAHTFALMTQPNCDTPCFIEIANSNDPADVTVIVTKSSGSDLKGQFPTSVLVLPKEIEMTEIRHTGDVLQEPIFRATAVSYQMLEPLTLFYSSISEASVGGYSIARRSIKGTPVSILAALQSFGWAQREAPATMILRERQEPPNDAERSETVEFLNSTGRSLAWFQQSAINHYLMIAVASPVMPDVDRDLIERIYKDPRVTNFKGVAGLIERDAQLRSRLLTWIFATLEGGEAIEDKMRKRALTLLKAAFPPEELSPYFDRYLQLLDASDAFDPRLATLIGRFDRDPTPRYSALITASNDNLRFANDAFCSADPRWHATMLPDHLALLIRYLNGEKLPREETHAQKMALIANMFGHRAELEPLLRDRDWGTVSFWRIMNEVDGRKDQLHRVCR